jgi:uncharacterized protein YegL
MMNVKKGLTEIVFILDKSGSMQRIKHDAIGGFNSFIEEQKKVDGEANVTLILFDDTVKVVYENKNINEIEDLNENTFVPSGLTAMLDAIGIGIDGLNKRLSENTEQPSNVVFAIMTDGFENASKEYRKDMIKNKIDNMQKQKDWQFIFLGANIDAVGTAESIGIKGMYAGQFVADSLGTTTAILNASEMVLNYRATGQMLSYDAVANNTANTSIDIGESLKNLSKNGKKDENEKDSSN